MNYEVIITCAVTGAGDTLDKHPGVPVTPEQVADAAIEAAGRGRRSLTCMCAIRTPAKAAAT